MLKAGTASVRTRNAIYSETQEGFEVKRKKQKFWIAAICDKSVQTSACNVNVNIEEFCKNLMLQQLQCYNNDIAGQTSWCCNV